MNEVSSLVFRSNIYPAPSHKGQLSHDVTFTSKISEPRALLALYSYGGTRGSLLTPLQESQFEVSESCVYADKGDFPWGTRRIDGVERIVCLCEKHDCKMYWSCVEEGLFDKGVFRNGFKRPDRSREKAESTWTTKEERTLREKYLYYMHKPRNWRIILPGKTVGEIDRKAVELGIVKTIPQHEDDYNAKAKKRSHRSGKKARIGGSVSATDSSKAPSRRLDPQRNSVKPTGTTARSNVRTVNPTGSSAKRGAKDKERLHNRPWLHDEDEILRANYPLYGPNMIDWDTKLFGRDKRSILNRAKQLGIDD